MFWIEIAILEITISIQSKIFIIQKIHQNSTKPIKIMKTAWGKIKLNGFRILVRLKIAKVLGDCRSIVMSYLV